MRRLQSRGAEIGGQAFLGWAALRFGLEIIDNLSRWQTIMSLREYIGWLTNPYLASGMMAVGLLLIYIRSLDESDRAYGNPSKPIHDAYGLPWVRGMNWTWLRRTLMVCAGGLILAIPISIIWLFSRPLSLPPPVLPLPSAPVLGHAPSRVLPSGSETAEKREKIKSEVRPGTPKEKSLPTRAGPGPISVTSNNQQGGITAGIVNINPIPRHLLLSKDQQDAVSASVARFAGNSTRIFINRPTEETVKFGADFRVALLRAGIHADSLTVLAYAPAANCYDHPGVWFMVGANRSEEANSLAAALVTSGVIEGRVYACFDYTADEFHVVISPP